MACRNRPCPRRPPGLRSTETKTTTATNTFVGRSLELDAIGAALDDLAEGRGQAILLCGEPGIGKSTLAQRAADLARAADVPVRWGFSWESGGAPTYWPWVQALRPLLDSPAPRRLLARRPDLAATLAQLLPELAAGSSDDSVSRLQPEQARFRLLEAVRALLRAAADDGPFMLVLEDLHAADADTLTLLQYLVPHVRELPVVFVGTFRDAEARGSPAAEPLWKAARAARLIHVSRLGEPEVREFLSRETHATPDAQFVRRVLETTEGNPLFLTELVALLESEGNAVAESGLLPDSVMQVIRQRLDRLPAGTVALLGVASVLGRDFELGELARLSGHANARVGELLEPCLPSEIVRPLDGRRYRFCHMLYRDVLHGGLSRSDRESLHRRHADSLRRRIEAGQQDQWASLATHLQHAGTGHRREAVDAWREAARYARRQLALADAVESLNRALALFGEGPGADPADRCELLLELADATLVMGDIEAGHRHCREAYRIARAQEDASLMARAALTYGSVFVIADVDAELVDCLRESLERLPPRETALRARVAARLAAALQPAPVTSVPMEMAREAVALARDTGDPAVLYRTLRSAISALMDFAEPGERLGLNREYAALAADSVDVPEQFRAHLRLMIDAGELGDVDTMDEAVAAAAAIARRLDLPHYRWKIAASRAMRACMRGDFAAAAEQIERAEALADQAGDKGARLTLPIQRFGLLRDWDDPRAPSLTEVRSQLERATELFPHAAVYVHGRLASYLLRSGAEEAGRAIATDELVTRTWQSGERSSIAALAEIALALGDREAAARAYEALLPYRDHCRHWGLMGMLWDGPMAFVLAELAHGLERDEEAEAHLRRALAVAERMSGRPQIARIHDALARVVAGRGDPATAATHTGIAAELVRGLRLTAPAGGAFGAAAVSVRPTSDAPGATAANFGMALEGDVWRVRFRGADALIRQSKGMRILGRLVASPDREFHVLDLNATGSAGTAAGDAGPQLDDKARAAYRQRLLDLEGELDEAEEFGDIGRADELRGEIDQLRRELSRAFGLGGRRRSSGSAAERARVNVQRRLRDAIRRIAEQLPDAGRYLENCVKTGTYCSYSPV